MAAPKGTAQTGQAVGRTEALMGKRIKAAAGTIAACTHKHDPKYAMCLGCKIRERAAKRVAAGGLTTEQLRAEKLARAQATVARAASKPARRAASGAKASAGTLVGEMAALQADFASLKGDLAQVLAAIKGATA